MDSKMFVVIVYVVYLIVGAVLNNLFVRDVVRDMVLNDIALHPEYESYSSDLNKDKAVLFVQFIIGIIFELFWPIFMVMWTIKFIKILVSRKSK